jgi:hypothetical protein
MSHSTGLNPGWWPHELDDWFLKRQDDLRAGRQQPLSSSGWAQAMRGQKCAVRLKDQTEVGSECVLKIVGL